MTNYSRCYEFPVTIISMESPKRGYRNIGREDGATNGTTKKYPHTEDGGDFSLALNFFISAYSSRY